MKRTLNFFSVLIFIATILVAQSHVFATTNYNNIIDDSIFDNSSSMSAAQIDSFLNTFPNSCISTSNGFSAPDPTGYNPTNKFTYGVDVTAGTVISHASQAYGINPQVLLSTLEKEQGLVVGDGGNISRPSGDPTDCGALAISASMGYNCPDTLVLTPYNGLEIYSHQGVGTASLNGTTLTGNGTTWGSSMVGNNIVFQDGTRVTVTAVNSATNLTVTNSNNAIENAQTYRIQVMSVQPTCVEHASYVGFSRQVIIAAWQFAFDRHRSEGSNNWYINKPSWDNSDDLGFCYSGYATQGGPYYLCPDQASHTNDPYVSHSGQYTIDSTVVMMTNGATATLYDYTPHLHGQDLFTNNFASWFGNLHYLFGTQPASQSVYAKSACNISNFDPSLVGRLYQPDAGDYIFTTNASEACSAIKLGYIWDGIVMESATGPSAVPVYRLATFSRHFFTADSNLRASYLSSGGWRDEGVAFYAYATAQAHTLPVYQLSNGPTSFFSSAGAEGNYYVQKLGYTSTGILFYTPDIDQSQGTVYRLKNTSGNGRFYTANAQELTSALSHNYVSEGNISTDDTMPDAHNLPVYRLYSPGAGHFYTTNPSERNAAVINGGYTSEGVGWYAPDLTFPNSAVVYRQTNFFTGLKLYTSNFPERNDARTYYGYTDEGAGWYGY